MESWQEATVAVVFLLLVIVIVSVLIWQIFKTGQVAIASDAATMKDALYQQAIADSTAAQQVVATRLAELTEGVQELRTRMTSIEKLLREVE
jgi:type II secretory pathway component PulM